MQNNEIAEQLAHVVDNLYTLAFCLNIIIERLDEDGETTKV